MLAVGEVFRTISCSQFCGWFFGELERMMVRDAKIASEGMTVYGLASGS